MFVVVISLGMSGCSGSDDKRATESPAASSPSESTAVEESLRIDLPGPTPLHSYFLSPAERTTIEQAQDIVVARCLQQFGYDRSVPDFSDRLKKAQASEDEADSRLYGVTDAEAARRFGLGLDLSDDSSGDSDSSRPASETFDLIYLGSSDGEAIPSDDAVSPGEVDGVRVPAGGCLGDARRAVTGSVRGTGVEVGRDLWIQASFRAQSDPQYAKVTDEWKACMKKSGYTVTAVLDDEGDSRRFARDLSTTEPSSAEITFAIEVVKCKKAVDLVPKLHKLDSAYATKAIEENQLALDEDRARLDAAIKKATRVVETDAS